MAVLRNLVRDVDVLLRYRSLVGRSPRADVRLLGEGASTEHATVHWDGADWLLRDLTSTNGTRVNGARLGGEPWPLVRGDNLVFGDPSERWLWVDGDAPRVRATRDDGVVVWADELLLLLPEADKPEASVYLRDNRWEIDIAGETRSVEDGDMVHVAGHGFSLDLPCADPTTVRTRSFAEKGRVHTARLTFRPSRDEEHVDVSIDVAGKAKNLPARAFNYMLLLLARARIADVEQGLPPEEAGWMYADDLADKLGTTAAKLNVDVHRARDILARAALCADAENIVERRRTTGQLRIGTAENAIESPSGSTPPPTPWK